MPPPGYDLRDCLFRVIVDLFGVAWLMRRPASYEVANAPEPAPCPPPASPISQARRGVGQEV